MGLLLNGGTENNSCAQMEPLLERCLRYLLLVMCAHPFAKEALTLHLARSEGHERYLGCNLMHHKVLASSQQHLMAEAPREHVTPSVRTQQCSLSRDQRRCATCAMRAALAVCERFQHESSSPCYRSSGGWVECSRLSESAASCGATSSADTTSSSPGSRYRAREARRSSARSEAIECKKPSVCR